MEPLPFATNRSLQPSHAGEEATLNPANSTADRLETSRETRTRIPMSVPRSKLTTPDIPGHHCHWLNDYAGRILQAQQAGYEFVSPEDALITMPDVAGSPVGAGTDLGSRVSVVVGKNEDGTPLRAYLMKIRSEWFKEDQAIAQGRVDDVHEAMRQGKQEVQGERASDRGHRYVKTADIKSTFTRRS